MAAARSKRAPRRPRGRTEAARGGGTAGARGGGRGGGRRAGTAGAQLRRPREWAPCRVHFLVNVLHFKEEGEQYITGNVGCLLVPADIAGLVRLVTRARET